MFIFHPDDASGNIAELRPGAVTIGSADEIVDILGNASYVNCTKVIIHSDSFESGFFDLRTGLAGEILQKFSNYRMRLAIVGDFFPFEEPQLARFHPRVQPWQNGMFHADRRRSDFCFEKVTLNSKCSAPVQGPEGNDSPGPEPEGNDSPGPGPEGAHSPESVRSHLLL